MKLPRASAPHSAALDTGIEWQEYAAGAEYAAESGELIAPGTLDAIEACGWALKGPTATPIGKGFRSINVQLRQRFSTYANLRPVHTLPGVPTRFDNVDLVIVRENTEDLYKGIEYMAERRDRQRRQAHHPPRVREDLPLCI